MKKINNEVNKKAFALPSHKKRNDSLIAYAFLAPALILFIVFTVAPFVMSLVLSFTDYNGVEFTKFSFDNFKNIIEDKYFMNSMKNVAIFAVFYVPLSIISSLIIAFLISKIKLKHNYLKVVYYIPSLTSGAAMIFVWKSLISSTSIVLDSGYMAMVVIIAISLYGCLGGNMLIYLAAMTGIDPKVYEAADIDGANKFQQFLHVTVPLLRSSTYFIFTTTLIGSFQLFDVIYLLGLYNNDKAISPVVEIYLSAKELRFGYGSAMSVVLFFFIMVVTVITQLFVRENNNQKKLFNHGKDKYAKKYASWEKTH